MKKLFNFQTMSEFNPLLTIREFFINPYMPDNAKLLKLADKLGKIKVKVIVIKDKPTIIYPISILDLGECMVEFKDVDCGIIYHKNMQMYFKIVDGLLCVNTILFR